MRLSASSLRILPGSHFTGNYFINYWYIDDYLFILGSNGRLDSRSKTFQTIDLLHEGQPRDGLLRLSMSRRFLAQNAIKGIKAVGHIGDTIAKAGSNMRGKHSTIGKDVNRRRTKSSRIRIQGS